jgi:murein L,D-transpeptidase YafK
VLFNKFYIFVFLDYNFFPVFMNIHFQKLLIFNIIVTLFVSNTNAQTSVDIKPFFKTIELTNKTEDTLRKQFEKQKLAWPPQSMYIRSFKYDRYLEVWVKSASKETFKLFKTYRVCLQSGTMGPKRVEGDFQVPEGFYYINEYNSNSNYHLALGLNYPNASDRILSDANRPGSAIYIHGDCVSTGCIPLQNIPVEEVYFLASLVRNQGIEFIPVHVFPIKYSVKKSQEYLDATIKDNAYLKQFNKNIKEVFDYFELKKELPLIMVNKIGEYVVY